MQIFQGFLERIFQEMSAQLLRQMLDGKIKRIFLLSLPKKGPKGVLVNITSRIFYETPKVSLW